AAGQGDRLLGGDVLLLLARLPLPLLLLRRLVLGDDERALLGERRDRRRDAHAHRREGRVLRDGRRNLALLDLEDRGFVRRRERDRGLLGDLLLRLELARGAPGLGDGEEGRMALRVERAADLREPAHERDE